MLCGRADRAKLPEREKQPLCGPQSRRFNFGDYVVEPAVERVCFGGKKNDFKSFIYFRWQPQEPSIESIQAFPFELVKIVPSFLAISYPKADRPRASCMHTLIRVQWGMSPAINLQHLSWYVSHSIGRVAALSPQNGSITHRGQKPALESIQKYPRDTFIELYNLPDISGR